MQTELPGFLSDVPGQLVVSTHSPQLVSAIDHRCIRAVRADGSNSKVKGARALAASPWPVS